MPLYDYSCVQCGSFREWKSMSESQYAVRCPHCNTLSKRMVTAPFLADMPNHNRIAHQRNEKSADEPVVVSRPQLNKAGTKRGHSHVGHNHSHQHSGRPWMIGH